MRANGRRPGKGRSPAERAGSALPVDVSGVAHFLPPRLRTTSMALQEQSLEPTPQTLEMVARVLRHEVGDLLQTIYSTVAILQDRLPPGQDLERRLLGDLKGRAEHCRNHLDAVVDLIVPLNLSPAPLDLGQLVGSLLPACRARFPGVEISFEARAPARVQGDARRLVQVGALLLSAASRAAKKEVRLEVLPAEGGAEVVWAVNDDGAGASSQQLEWLTRPFANTQNATFGLGLALAARVAALHGGRAEAEVLPGGGCRVRVVLPAAEPEHSPRGLPQSGP